MPKRRWIIAAGVSFVLVGAGVYLYQLDLIPLPEVEDGDYPMQPVSVFVEDGRSGIQYLARGERGWWNTDTDGKVVWVDKATKWKTSPFKEVKAYPRLKSSRPLYGGVNFGKGRIEPGKGSPYYFVVDESGGTGNGYDRLYFDLNHDFDLTNDSELIPLEDPPRPSHQYSHWGTNVVFPPLSIPFDFGPGYGTIPVEVLPRLGAGGEKFTMFFVATEARKGKIRMGHYRFTAVLSQSMLIAGRYDSPDAELNMRTGIGPLWERWWGDDGLSSLRVVGGKFYSISTTPTGDTLKVRRYRGALGLIRIGPGSREIGEVSMSGSLSSETVTVPVGRLSRPYSDLERVEECEVPVGDYGPLQMGFRYGRLKFWLSNNYHVDGKRQGAHGKPRVYAIKIREDRPFVLDFSTRPEVMFAEPAKDRTFKRGDEVAVMAVLTDPVLNTMIRGLDDTTRTTSRKQGDRTIETFLPLDPTVTISDSTGKKVAEGTMPFG